jgi:diacylglycerol kinase (ATP)
LARFDKLNRRFFKPHETGENRVKAKVILNPFANRWGAQAQIGKLRELFEAADQCCDVAVTQAPGEGIDIAEAAVHEGYDVVIAAGGDGTINEVVNGILRATPEGPTIPFGILPLGSANDFNKIAGLPDSVDEAIEVILGGQTRQIDAGQVNDRYFVNNSAIAMEPTVTLESWKIKRVSGESRYLIALLRALARLSAWQMDVKWDGGQFQGPAYLLSVCNSERTGGFTMAPGARIDDGVFDLVIAKEVPKLKFLQMLLLLLQGKHTGHEDVIFTRVTQISITTNPGTPVHADGEVFSMSETEFHYSVLPGKVTLISP